jgi:hypothetical protein
MKRLAALSALSAVGLVLTVGASGAAAATEIGDPCAANGFAEGVAASVFTFASSSPLPPAAPTSGVITKWTSSIGVLPEGKTSEPETFKVFRPNRATTTALVVGSDAQTLITGLNTFPVRIPVQAGDLIGLSPNGEDGIVFCEEHAVKSSLGAFEVAAPTGAIIGFTELMEPLRMPVTATVEPDADGDGYGDETQDQCPTDASTHEACPAPKAAPTPPPPPAPITLSDSAAAKKGLVAVSLTSSAQATVTIAGTVEIGKGKSVKLSGGTQIVAPGSLAKFTVVFPAKLKAALKQLPSSKKLSLILIATAPGATAKSLKVKVPGQEKAAPRRHKHVS